MDLRRSFLFRVFGYVFALFLFSSSLCGYFVYCALFLAVRAHCVLRKISFIFRGRGFVAFIIFSFSIASSNVMRLRTCVISRSGVL